MGRSSPHSDEHGDVDEGSGASDFQSRAAVMREFHLLSQADISKNCSDASIQRYHAALYPGVDPLEDSEARAKLLSTHGTLRDKLTVFELRTRCEEEDREGPLGSSYELVQFISAVWDARGGTGTFADEQGLERQARDLLEEEADHARATDVVALRLDSTGSPGDKDHDRAVSRLSALLYRQGPRGVDTLLKVLGKYQGKYQAAQQRTRQEREAAEAAEAEQQADAAAAVELRARVAEVDNLSPAARAIISERLHEKIIEAREEERAQGQDRERAAQERIAQGQDRERAAQERIAALEAALKERERRTPTQTGSVDSAVDSNTTTPTAKVDAHGAAEQNPGAQNQQPVASPPLSTATRTTQGSASASMDFLYEGIDNEVPLPRGSSTIDMDVEQPEDSGCVRRRNALPDNRKPGLVLSTRIRTALDRFIAAHKGKPLVTLYSAAVKKGEERTKTDDLGGVAAFRAIVQAVGFASRAFYMECSPGEDAYLRSASLVAERESPLTAEAYGNPEMAAALEAQVFALFLGLHAGLSDSRELENAVARDRKERGRQGRAGAVQELLLARASINFVDIVCTRDALASSELTERQILGAACILARRFAALLRADHLVDPFLKPAEKLVLKLQKRRTSLESGLKTVYTALCLASGALGSAFRLLIVKGNSLRLAQAYEHDFEEALDVLEAALDADRKRMTEERRAQDTNGIFGRSTHGGVNPLGAPPAPAAAVVPRVGAVGATAPAAPSLVTARDLEALERRFAQQLQSLFSASPVPAVPANPVGTAGANPVGTAVQWLSNSSSRGDLTYGTAKPSLLSRITDAVERARVEQALKYNNVLFAKVDDYPTLCGVILTLDTATGGSRDVTIHFSGLNASLGSCAMQRNKRVPNVSTPGQLGKALGFNCYLNLDEKRLDRHQWNRKPELGSALETYVRTCLGDASFTVAKHLSDSVKYFNTRSQTLE